MPSSIEDYDFLLSARVRWCPLESSVDAPPVNAGGVAVDAVLARARQLTARRHPRRGGLVQHELNGELGVMREDPTGRVRTMALDVVLRLRPEDEERLEKLSTVRKNEAVWEHERKYEQSRRAYLGDDVLKNTGNAVVWWLAKHDDKIDRVVSDIGLLAELSAAANNEDVPKRFHHLTRQPVPATGPDPTEYAGPRAEGISANGHAFDEGMFNRGAFNGATHGFRDAAAHRTPPEPPPSSSADHFEAMLDTMGLHVGDPRRSLFSAAVASAAESFVEDEQTAEELRNRFDTAPTDPRDPSAETGGARSDDEPSTAGPAEEPTSSPTAPGHSGTA